MDADGFRKMPGPQTTKSPQNPLGAPASHPAPPNPFGFGTADPRRSPQQTTLSPLKRLGAQIDTHVREGIADSSKRMKSPLLTSERNHFVQNLYSSHEEAHRADVLPLGLAGQRRSPTNIVNSPPPQRFQPVDYSDIYDAGPGYLPKPANFSAAEGAKSPLFPSKGLFGKPSFQPDFGSHEIPHLSYDSQRSYPINIASGQTYQAFQSVAYSAINDAGTGSLSKPADFSAIKRAKSPPLLSSNSLAGTSFKQVDPERSDVSPLRLANQRRSPVKFDNPSPHKSFQPVDSPPLLSSNSLAGTSFKQVDPERSDVSPLRLANQRRSPVKFDNPSPHKSFQPVDYSDIYEAGTANSSAAKRARSPPLISSNGSLNTFSIPSDSERELKAKAQRLARFNVELNQPVDDPHDVMKHKPLGIRGSQVPVDGRNADSRTDEASSLVNRGVFSDSEALGSSTVVVGICPDMCPELERDERERKGDLDKHERLDGDRNQTNKFLAVKKYTRTAEREANLIRPMPVLQKTIDYLLQLLNRSYNDNFLSVYNFLWDRMRAIRMDLRMQHLFNRKAIIMLEQMIRLHIIAMHELCEYSKGEGFSEGFDAHLNIEQMNKTSVELFQMYDNHRKKGVNIQTEKEFRCYYALLKLDKHPGYKVEPAELSHDLAKMTPEIRCSQELLFARDVARACRVGNYIAFFRLARKATFLQACLMHAHFAKVRKQALASLHSGVQNNQGIPISHVVKWLAMEGEDIESLLDYHGFSVKRFEEKYMVKEGPFLNIDTDFTTKCSELVHLKKSKMIVEDILIHPILSDPTVENKGASETIDQSTVASKTEDQDNAADEEMLEYKVDYVHRVVSSTPQLVEEPLPAILNREYEDETREGSLFGHGPESVDVSLSNHEQYVGDGQMLEFNGDIMDGRTVLEVEENIVQVGVTDDFTRKYPDENFDSETAIDKSLDSKASRLEPNQYEIANEKLKQILRKWKQLSSMKREIREQREFLATAALSSLSLGPPFRLNKAHPTHVAEELNIDYVANERCGRHEKSWLTLNVSELVAPVLSAKNPHARCIFWKVVIFVQANETQSQFDQLVLRWLRSKLRGNEGDGELVVSSPHVSIWKKWINTHSSEPTCCLSVIREGTFDTNQTISEDDIIAGTSCVMFVTSETIPWDIQRVRFNRLLMSVPTGSRLPLLVIGIGTFKERNANSSDEIIDRLGLTNVDKTKIGNYSVEFLPGESSYGQSNGFFNDDRLKEALQWLANHSPLQPDVCMVKAQRLVLSYLQHSVDILDSMKSCQITPHHCITAFNEALNRLVQKITTAASVNSNHWPCPEISLLGESTVERALAQRSLPNVGWSSAARIQSLVKAIKECELPSFPSLAWMKQSCYTKSQVYNQKLAIEKCLTSYLSESSKLFDVEFAVKEASIMVQVGAVLELQGASYHIVPRWPVIFQRIYNWQLMKLSVRNLSDAYVLEPLDEIVDSDLPYRLELDSFSSDEQQMRRSANSEPFLDEMIEGSCCVPLPLLQHQSVRTPVSSPIVVVHEGANASDTDGGNKAGGVEPRYVTSLDGEVFSPTEAEREKSKPSPVKRNDRLSMVLKKCNQLQDMIDRMLTFYK